MKAVEELYEHAENHGWMHALVTQSDHSPALVICDEDGEMWATGWIVEDDSREYMICPELPIPADKMQFPLTMEWHNGEGRES